MKPLRNNSVSTQNKEYKTYRNSNENILDIEDSKKEESKGYNKYPNICTVLNVVPGELLTSPHGNFSFNKLGGIDLQDYGEQSIHRVQQYVLDLVNHPEKVERALPDMDEATKAVFEAFYSGGIRYVTRNPNTKFLCFWGAITPKWDEVAERWVNNCNGDADNFRGSVKFENANTLLFPRYGLHMKDIEHWEFLFKGKTL